ncbi:hypothetical protein E2P81_ATG05520 [Venturia nashicola]|uniref:Uncharacterized protein n=1 Tax=Venturia nashicola TaxID=86259 RepID=A0A4Z1P3G7_9PEZI|nr:hypothetical protein E6O75_ATG05654 [Venturia nashicola]TLD32544.1 hypothetical protein E2P81_ATG05520 [Venturia nashicola]
MALPVRLTFLRWRPAIFWTVVGLVILEFPLTVAVLALFGIADGNTYRTKLWQDGNLNGFNSSPAAALYAAANHEKYTKPLIWSNFMTQFNLVITVLCMFIMLVKALLLYLHTLYPFLSLATHGLEVGLWAYSVYGQQTPDMSDPAHPQPGPAWYITKNCNVAFKKSNVGFCMQAKASFYVACVMLALFAIQFLVALQALIFGPEPGNTDDEIDSVYTISKMNTPITPTREWEMVQIPPTPGTMGGMKSPVTPRTRAFNELEGGAEMATTGGWSIKRDDLPWSGRNSGGRYSGVKKGKETV